MSLSHPQHSYISKDRTLKNVKDLIQLKSISPGRCGRELCLSQVPYNLFNKLKSVILHSQIEKISLIACFNDPYQTLQILESMQRNDCLFSVHLNLLDNVHNNQCIDVIIDLITRGVVNSIEVPRELNEENSERLLAEILKSQRELKIVNLNGCTLNTTALSHLHDLLAKGRISKELNLANCQGICNSKLTTKDKSDIQEALDLGKKQTKKIPKVDWFDVVMHIGDVDMYRGKMRVSFKEVVRMIYNRKTKRREERVIPLVRLGLDAWQQYKPGSKRSNQSDNADIAEKRSGMDDDPVESISKQLDSQMLSDKKGWSKWRRFLPVAWNKKALDISNPLIRVSDLVKEDNRYSQLPYNEMKLPQNDDINRHLEQKIVTPRERIFAEVHTTPEDPLMRDSDLFEEGDRFLQQPYNGKRLGDVFQEEIAQAFPRIVDFKKFSRLAGLQLDEHEIDDIVEDHRHRESVHEPKMQMLMKWKQKEGSPATVSKRGVLPRGFRHRDSNEGQRHLTRQRNDNMSLQFEKEIATPRKQFFAEVHTTPEDQIDQESESQVYQQFLPAENIRSFINKPVHHITMSTASLSRNFRTAKNTNVNAAIFNSGKRLGVVYYGNNLEEADELKEGLLNTGYNFVTKAQVARDDSKRNMTSAFSINEGDYYTPLQTFSIPTPSLASSLPLILKFDLPEDLDDKNEIEILHNFEQKKHSFYLD